MMLDALKAFQNLISGNEGHPRGLHGHRITHHPSYEVGRHDGCNICSVGGSAQGNFFDSSVHNGYYATASPYSFTGMTAFLECAEQRFEALAFFFDFMPSKHETSLIT